MTQAHRRALIVILLLAFAVLNQYTDRVGQKTAPGDTGATISAPSPTPNGTFPVSRVVDGDTFDVTLDDGTVARVRLLGMNTPETVDPRRPVECFGIEASNRAKELLSNARVMLEADPTQQDRDRYDRLLRYAALEDGTDFGLAMIRDGFAYEYEYNLTYQRRAAYVKAQEEAVAEGRGMWAKGACIREKQ